MRQGDVYATPESPLTSEREVYVVLSGDMYNDAGTPTVIIAEIALGNRYRDSALALPTEYGLVLLDRLVWIPRSALGDRVGRLTRDQTARAVDLVCALMRNN